MQEFDFLLKTSLNIFNFQITKQTKQQTTMLTLSFWAVIGIIVGMFVAPRMTLGILLIVMGQIALGVIVIIWGAVVMLAKLVD